MIRREDEYRLLFITGCDGYTKPPMHPWKPFGEIPLQDSELPVQQHAYCDSHFLDYGTWNWSLTNGDVLEDPGIAITTLAGPDPTIHKTKKLSPIRYGSDLSSEITSEVATRGIFSWLRSTG